MGSVGFHLLFGVFNFPGVEKSFLYARFTCCSPFNLRETPKQKHLRTDNF